MRAALISRVTALVLLAGLSACERDAVKPVAEPAEAAGPVAAAVNPADVWCLDPAVLRAEPVGSEATWARYRHWTLCDHDAGKAGAYLDALVQQDDPEALHVKSLRVAETDPVEAARLQKRAEDLGWRRPTRQDEMNALAAPPS